MTRYFIIKVVILIQLLLLNMPKFSSCVSSSSLYRTLLNCQWWQFLIFLKTLLSDLLQIVFVFGWNRPCFWFSRLCQLLHNSCQFFRLLRLVSLSHHLRIRFFLLQLFLNLLFSCCDKIYIVWRKLFFRNRCVSETLRIQMNL